MRSGYMKISKRWRDNGKGICQAGTFYNQTKPATQEEIKAHPEWFKKLDEEHRREDANTIKR